MCLYFICFSQGSHLVPVLVIFLTIFLIQALRLVRQKVGPRDNPGDYRGRSSQHFRTKYFPAIHVIYIHCVSILAPLPTAGAWSWSLHPGQGLSYSSKGYW